MQNHPAPSSQSTATRPPTASTFKPRVRRLGPGRYLVESASKPGTGHPVTLDRCNCTGFSYRGTCRHVALVRAIEPRMVVWYGQATATPATDTEQRLAHALRALADADEQSDERAVLLRRVDELERQVAADSYAAFRAA